MLEELIIKDFALIEQLTVPWTKGLNVLTGETGAGKSIIIDALDAVLGGRVGAATIRIGAERASIEAVFRETPEVSAWLKEQGLKGDETEVVFVFREITRSGSRSRINGTMVNLALVQELKQKLLTVHAQHEARTLMSGHAQLEIIDGMGDHAHKKLKDRVRTLYQLKRDLAAQLEDLTLSEQERRGRLELAGFQLKELSEAFLQDPDEDKALTARCQVLANAAELADRISRARELLNGSDTTDGACALDRLQEALRELKPTAMIDDELNGIIAPLTEAVAQIDEAARTLRRYADNLDTDPEALSALEARLASLAAIRRKYGPTLADAMARRQQLEAEVIRLENAGSAAEAIEKELDEAAALFQDEAEKLSASRHQIAEQLADAVRGELSVLGLERCRFEISFRRSAPGASGYDSIELLIAPNPGQPVMPLAKIASGGELSRIMLAIKSIVAGADRTPTVVFDEIDTGLSGTNLKAVRDRLVRLARTHQILCITHQPIIASSADNHLEVTKELRHNSTRVAIKALGPEARVKALAKMAAGGDGEQAAMRFARSLYEEGCRLRTCPSTL